MKNGRKINNSNRNFILLSLLLAITISGLWFVASVSATSSTNLFSAYIQDVKHNSTHKSDLKGLSDSIGTATVRLKTDIFNDSACNSVFGSAGKACINNDDMKFSVQVSRGETIFYKNLIYGSPEVNSFQVTTSTVGTKSNPDLLSIKFEGPKYFNAFGHAVDISEITGPHWFVNNPVSQINCGMGIWNGATVDCKLVTHYAWTYGQ